MNSSSVHPVKFSVFSSGVLLFLCGALLVGCPSSTDQVEAEGAADTGAQQRSKRAAEAEARDAALRMSGRSRGATEVDPDREEVKPLAFDTVEITPADPKIDVKQLRARSTLMPGATPYTEVSYQWFVGGKELVGYTRAVLRNTEGKWTTGDTVKVIALAADEKGRTARSLPAEITFGNSAPVITTDLRKVKYLNGTRLKAVDDDGDEITWSVEGDPPGVSVSRTGVVSVRNVQMEKDWNGEAVFVATDPYGARSEIHIPLGVNAAKAAKTEEAGTKEQRASSRTMTGEELQRAADEDAKRFENMSEEEINKELDRREAINPD